jgi:hypothetical protein
LAVDPGKTTGYAFWDGEYFSEGELECETFLQFAAKLIEPPGHIDFVCCERYIISAQTGRLSQAPWSLESIGALRFLCVRGNTEFLLQNASNAKRFGTDERLNHIGWPKPSGAGHARDAQRHLLLFLCNNRILDESLLRR